MSLMGESYKEHTEREKVSVSCLIKHGLEQIEKLLVLPRLEVEPGSDAAPHGEKLRGCEHLRKTPVA